MYTVGDKPWDLYMGANMYCIAISPFPPVFLPAFIPFPSQLRAGFASHFMCTYSVLYIYVYTITVEQINFQGYPVLVVVFPHSRRSPT